MLTTVLHVAHRTGIRVSGVLYPDADRLALAPVRVDVCRHVAISANDRPSMHIIATTCSAGEKRSAKA